MTSHPSNITQSTICILPYIYRYNWPPPPSLVKTGLLISNKYTHPGIELVLQPSPAPSFNDKLGNSSEYFKLTSSPLQLILLSPGEYYQPNVNLWPIKYWTFRKSDIFPTRFEINKGNKNVITGFLLLKLSVSGSK